MPMADVRQSPSQAVSNVEFGAERATSVNPHRPRRTTFRGKAGEEPPDQDEMMVCEA